MNLKDKRVIFCLPGKQFSDNFLMCWSELLVQCITAGMDIKISQHYSPSLYHVRNYCLGGNTLKGINQKPFQGNIEYDYIMWIDSDQIFTFDHFKKLLNANKDIVSGLYMMSDNTNYATIEKWDEEYYKIHGRFEFLNRESVAKKTDLFKADYTGFGWMLIKKGVFEKIEYPWFKPFWTEFTMDDLVIRDFSFEDVAFCKDAQKNGFDIWIDPTAIVGHEKMMIL